METPENLKPYNSEGSKGAQIEAMFDHIAPAYDFMNAAMSLGQFRRWRRQALEMAAQSLEESKMENLPDEKRRGLRILDVATGTGDVAFALAERFPGARITGADLSRGMMKVGLDRLNAIPAPQRPDIEFMQADCLDLPFADGQFDLVTVAYGVRNFQDLRRGLREISRVLKPGGTLCILELSRPRKGPARWGYSLYTSLIPLAGKIIAGDSEAYRYLPQSIAACPQRDDMAALMEECGFNNAKWRQMTLGAVCAYTARKK